MKPTIEQVIPKRNERWLNKNTGLTARVMTPLPVEGYVMARYKGAGPWLLHVNDWQKKFERVDRK